VSCALSGEDALEFKPDRWLTDADSNGVRTLIQKSPFAFPQFNAGFRLCLGRSMALMEAKVVAVSILRKYRLEVKPNHDASYRLNIVLFQKNGLPVQVHQRDE
jgi:cytochrome P450